MRFHQIERLSRYVRPLSLGLTVLIAVKFSIGLDHQLTQAAGIDQVYTIISFHFVHVLCCHLSRPVSVIYDKPEIDQVCPLPSPWAFLYSLLSIPTGLDNRES
ncbi:hypothetical protein HDV57DRAFT_229964 [Trichoderma longibrachiatum]